MSVRITPLRKPALTRLALSIRQGLGVSLMLGLASGSHGGILINEIFASHTGADDTEFLELYGDPWAPLSGMSLIGIEGNNDRVPGSIDFRYDFSPRARIGGNGFFLVGNDGGLASNYGVTPNNTLVANSFENSSSTYALVETASLSGASLTGAEIVMDAVALRDDSPSTFFFDAPVIGPDGTFFPAGARRVSDGVDTGSAADWVISDFFLGSGNTPTRGQEAPVINELLVSHSGADDTEYVELYGDSGSLAGLSLISVEGQSGGAGAGTIDERIDFGTGDKVGDNRFFLAGNGSGLGTNYGVSPDRDIDPNFENGDSTYALVRTDSLSGDVGSSVTGDEDVIDSVALREGDSGTYFFDAPVVGPDGRFLPAGVRRVVDGADTDTAADFAIADFFLGDANTPTPGGATEPPTVLLTSIMQIQGKGHTSALVGERVTTTGIVTAVDGNGFYLQDASGDGDDATSDGLFVFTGGAPSVAVGDDVTVEGSVSEFVPGGAATRNLSTTQLAGSPVVSVRSSGNALPDSVRIGAGGRLPPTETIDEDNFTQFEPATDGIDFFESLEGMRVTVERPRAIAGTNRFGEIFTTVEGASSGPVTPNGGLKITENDFNPERIQINRDTDLLADSEYDGGVFPSVDTGALLGDVTGVVDYSFGNFEIKPTERFDVTPSAITPEITTIPSGGDNLTVASYNVLNLDPVDSPDAATLLPSVSADADIANGRFTRIAEQIVNNLQRPDIIGLQEIQDSSGEQNDGVTGADATLNRLIDEIVAAGGPRYAFVDNTFITDGASGGLPGGNIRTAFLYNPDRVDLVDGSVMSIADVDQATDPDNPFFDSRLPLVATFTFNGEAVTVVNNHFSSKGGSAPIFGIEQPFEARQEDPDINGSLDERRDQAQAVFDYVAARLLDPDADVIMLGDFNEFEFLSPLETFDGLLRNLALTLPEESRYTYIFQGNSQALDHMLVSEGLFDLLTGFDIVHVNADFAESPRRASDHDPLLAAFHVGGDIAGVPTPGALGLLGIGLAALGLRRRARVR
jgi:predicted extracellular nuclease